MKLFHGSNNMALYVEDLKDAAIKEIDSLTQEDFENTEDSLEIIITSKHQIPLITLGEAYRKNVGEIKKDISKDNRFWMEVNPTYKTATLIEIHVPFEGKAGFLSIQPSTCQMNYIEGEVTYNEIILPFSFFPDIDKSEALRKEIDSALDYVKKQTMSMNKDIESFNQKLPSLISSQIKRRKSILENQKKIMVEIGIPEKEIKMKQIGFVKPIEKKSIKIQNIVAVSDDIVLENEIYEEITNSINSLGINLERVNKIVRSLDEESLRDILFVALNSSFRGTVSTEAFNKSGKTDLLIRQNNKNLYISECKIWRGDVYFNEGIDQLLSNLTWRDSKCSYIIFSKNDDPNKVISKAQELLSRHPNHVSLIKKISESCYLFKFKNKNDPNKNLLLTLHLFSLK
ncbi:MAG: hypothetical protein WC796_00030 [Candidatus Pacearchaeota archaeon]|jgi:hypothetical protein